MSTVFVCSCACVCVRAYAYVPAHVYVHVYVCPCLCLCMRTCMCMFMYVYMYIYISICIYTHVFVLTCADSQFKSSSLNTHVMQVRCNHVQYMYIYSHAYIHTCIHTYIHAYVHTCTFVQIRLRDDSASSPSYLSLTLWLQVYKQCLRWGLQCIDRTFSGYLESQCLLFVFWKCLPDGWSGALLGSASSGHWAAVLLGSCVP